MRKVDAKKTPPANGFGGARVERAAVRITLTARLHIERPIEVAT